MNILMLGDVVSAPGVNFITANLPRIRRQYSVDFCVVNAENSAGNGITLNIARKLVNAGADVLTMGNHTFRRIADFSEVVSNNIPIIRPANYPPGTMGFGHIIVECGNISIAVINLVGRLFLEPIDCPYRSADSAIKDISNRAQIILVDFHAEATGEKVAMGWHLDGRVSAVVGTHTHVQTADERIFPNGTGYISDLGMVGATDSVLGVDKEIALDRIIRRVAEKNQPGIGPVEMCGVLLDIDANTGKCLDIKRVRECD
ncbi:MAG: TIGR00282 family metallophosphoesterase [Clostridiales bacterium]|jgi:metallophosphoesterase (TIGR00282 family)|nr:TIGR00282 family metallophosphoesterase [Clostridiales bacterium]